MSIDSPVTEGPASRSASDSVFFGIMNGLELGTFVPCQRLV